MTRDDAHPADARASIVPGERNRTAPARRAVRWHRTVMTLASLLCAGTLLPGCDSAVDKRPQTARPAEESYRDFGAYVVHYNAVRSDELLPEIASAYGIERSADRVLLTVVMLARSPDGTTSPADGSVTASVRNLNGQLKSIEMRRVQEGASVDFVGTVGISGEEILVFDVVATPRGAPSGYSVQLKREFFAD